ncbi:AAA family ATPase [Nocardia sp. CA-128927]|uniref:AAA family ATPase n=1 Tax=Nocardia sp. CA-128927 TaxID=3239975 RepID=UPI003D975CAA
MGLTESVLAALADASEALTDHGVLVMCGFPGSGKSTAAAWVAAQAGAYVLDKDDFASRLERDVMGALVGDPSDRNSELYWSVMVPGIYEGLIRTGLGIAVHHPIVLDGPFLSVIRQAADAGLSLGQHIRAVAQAPDSLVVHSVWLDSSAVQIKQRMITRGAERDRGKLADWETYRQNVLDSGTREIAHTVVDVVISN